MLVCYLGMLCRPLLNDLPFPPPLLVSWSLEVLRRSTLRSGDSFFPLMLDGEGVPVRRLNVKDGGKPSFVKKVGASNSPTLQLCAMPPPPGLPPGPPPGPPKMPPGAPPGAPPRGPRTSTASQCSLSLMIVHTRLTPCGSGRESRFVLPEHCGSHVQ